jgi:hypothetical protein
LKVAIAVSGAYSSGNTFQAGLAQPSAPTIAASSSFGAPQKAVSCKIERWRPSTGARSRASNTSAVITPAGHKVRVTFPAAASSQTHWRVYFTIEGFGDRGVHYAVEYNGSLDVAETDVAAGTVDGIARSLEFDFRDSDLFPHEASYDDYAPPAGTHAVRLGNVMHVLGAYADSTDAPTSTNTGTGIACSKPNAYESYIPAHLLALPEQVVDVLARPIDNYAYIGCENSIHALQYIGYRGDDLPPSVISTIFPDIGIKKPYNWCQFKGRLAVYTAEGSLLIMDADGNLNDQLAAPITRLRS